MGSKPGSPGAPLVHPAPNDLRGLEHAATGSTDRAVTARHRRLCNLPTVPCSARAALPAWSDVFVFGCDGRPFSPLQPPGGKAGAVEQAARAMLRRNYRALFEEVFSEKPTEPGRKDHGYATRQVCRGSEDMGAAAT